MKRTSSTTSKPSQLDKFKAAARELETDDDEARFDERVKALALQPLAGSIFAFEPGVRGIADVTFERVG